MNINKNTIVGELVAADYRAASVLTAFGIDFCCKGNVSIGHACELNSLETDSVLNELTKATQSQDDSVPDYQSWPVETLIKHIEEKHHKYVEAKIPELKSYLRKIAQVHGSRHPELIEIEQLFFTGSGELAAHLKKEEFLLFPFIRKLSRAMATGKDPGPSLFATVKNPVSAMMEEHDAEGSRFSRIAQLSNNYTPPADACNTYRAAYSLLDEFEKDLHLHIHLENNILFPKAIELEKELTGTNYGE